MLSNEVSKLEAENQKLKEIIRILGEDKPKPKDCRHCMKLYPVLLQGQAWKFPYHICRALYLQSTSQKA